MKVEIPTEEIKKLVKEEIASVLNEYTFKVVLEKKKEKSSSSKTKSRGRPKKEKTAEYEKRVLNFMKKDKRYYLFDIQEGSNIPKEKIRNIMSNLEYNNLIKRDKDKAGKPVYEVIENGNRSKRN